MRAHLWGCFTVAEAVEVCSVGDVSPGSGRVFLVGGRPIAIWHVGGRFFATDARCPHEQGPLVSGLLTGTEISCPMHAWSFNITTGKGIDPPDARINTYPIARKGNRIFVTVDEPSSEDPPTAVS